MKQAHLLSIMASETKMRVTGARKAMARPGIFYTFLMGEMISVDMTSPLDDIVISSPLVGQSVIHTDMNFSNVIADVFVP